MSSGGLFPAGAGRDSLSDPAQWFDPLGPCSAKCGRQAQGILMSNRNDRMGPYCKRCAEARIRKAKSGRNKARFEAGGR